jgi:Pyridoxamine 5'-phosphate oxidase
MSQQEDLGAIARAIIEDNLYMALGTSDEQGQPWVSPVYYAHAGYREFYWVSLPEAAHSRNIAVRPQISIVIFDSQAPIGTGQGVYLSAVAEELTGADLDGGIDIYSRRSQLHGAAEWEASDVRSPAVHRLYRATVSDQWILDKTSDRRGDRRIQVFL